MKVFVVAFFIASAVALCHAKCDEGYSGSAIIVCNGRPVWVKGGGGRVKNWRTAATYCRQTAISDQECINLNDDAEIVEEIMPIESGYTLDDRTCNVYARPDCRGRPVSVQIDGWFKFPVGPILSFRCPCRKAPADVLGG